ncbi:MAG: patatin-like phospholipase family protein [Acidimicrobiales bacterium]
MPHPDAPRPAAFADWPRPLAFVLSGGGAFGPVQVGMLKALRHHGIGPDLIVGTSIGALHGAVVAAHGPGAVELLEELWSTADRRVVFGGRRAMAASLVRTRSLAGVGRLAAIIDRTIDVPTFEDLGVPFAAVATDALSGEPELLTSGPLRSALLASAAVPGLLPPVVRDGRTYVDGGVAANVPIRQAIAFGARSVVSLDATPPQIADRVPTSFAGALLHSMSLMMRSQRANAVDDLAARYPIAVLPSSTPPNMGSFNFSRTRQLLDESFELSVATLDEWASEAAAVNGDR